MAGAHETPGRSENEHRNPPDGAYPLTYTLHPSLKGRAVFISGGSSGIGAELVRAFAAQGCSVAFCGTKPAGGDPLIAELTQAGHAAPWYQVCDVRDISALQTLLSSVGEKFGAIRVLVNNAGRDDRHSEPESFSGVPERRALKGVRSRRKAQP